MEEKDQQAPDGSSSQSFEKSIQPAESTSTKDTDEQIISSPEPDHKVIVQNEPEKPKALQAEPQTSDMEIHHHGHVHHQKKWKEYLFQFLMLFLAVFCGFLAEYKLEHMIEHNREKQLIRSMINGLEGDVVSLNETIELTNKIALGKDSFILLLDKEKWSQNEVVQLYEFHRKYMGGTRPSFSSKPTIAQFHAGGLRLVRNQQAADSITVYATDLQLIEEYLAGSYLDAALKSMDFSGYIFDNKYIRMLPGKQFSFGQPQFDSLGSHPSLLTTDKKDIKRFSFLLEIEKDYALGSVLWYTIQKERAVRLLQLLKKEYHLK